MSAKMDVCVFYLDLFWPENQRRRQNSKNKLFLSKLHEVSFDFLVCCMQYATLKENVLLEFYTNALAKLPV